jgi:hypothetical protein
MKGHINGDINLGGKVMSAAIMTLTAITDLVAILELNYPTV